MRAKLLFAFAAGAAVLLFSPMLGAGQAHAASFNCRFARLPDERAICADLSLNDQDVRMSLLYDITRHMVAMGGRGAIMDRQVTWLRQRRACGADRTCLARAYAGRIYELNQVMDRVYSHAPF